MRGQRYRFVHVGTGLTGREALRAVIRDPALDLIGVGAALGCRSPAASRVRDVDAVDVTFERERGALAVVHRHR